MMYDLEYYMLNACKAVATIFFVSPHIELRKPSQSVGKKKKTSKKKKTILRGIKHMVSRSYDQGYAKEHVFFFLSIFHKQTTQREIH